MLKVRLLLAIVCLGLLIGTAYWETVSELLHAVLNREGSSHGIFIPFLSAYIVWKRRERIKNVPVKANFSLSLLFFAVGSAIYLVIPKGEYFLLFSSISLLTIVIALVLLLFGTQFLRTIVLPLLVLTTMIPLPSGIYNWLAEAMRIMTTWGAVLVTSSLGVPLFRDGYTISLPDINLFVAPSCSGIRYLLSYFAFSIIYAALYKDGVVGRIVVVLSSVPLAIIAGIGRLSVIFLAAHYIDPVLAGPRPHIYLSWVVFAICLFASIVADQYFSNLKRKPAKCDCY